VNQREILFFKDYFKVFYQEQTWKVQKKILWTFKIIESVDRIPEIYSKYLEIPGGFMK